MKNIAFIMSCIVMLLACETEKPDKIEPKQMQMFQGNNYCLVSVIGGWSPDLWYNNKVEWRFQNGNEIIVIVTDTVINKFFPPLNTNGRYTYTVSGNVFTIDNSQVFEYKVMADTLLLYQNVAADGRQITLIKK